MAPEKLARLRAADLGEGPWGQAGSPTWVGETKLLEINRTRQMLQGSLPEQIAQAVSILKARGALVTTTPTSISSPTIAGSERAVRVTSRAMIAPVPAKGMATSRTRGLSRDRNVATITM